MIPARRDAGELPAARVAPLGGEAERRALAALSRRQRALAQRVLGDAGVFVVAASATRVDVGGWFGGSRVCVCALADELVLMAPARGPVAWLLGLLGRAAPAAPAAPAGRTAAARPFVARIPFGQLVGSTYNHVTGELLLSASTAPLRRLRLDPMTGLQLLAQIDHGIGARG